MPTLSGLVDQDGLERLCTLQVLADHGDLEAADALHDWCAHDPEAREVRVRLTTTCHAVRPGDEH